MPSTIAVQYKPSIASFICRIYEPKSTTLVESITMTESGTRAGYYTGTVTSATGVHVAVLVADGNQEADGYVKLEDGATCLIGPFEGMGYGIANILAVTEVEAGVVTGFPARLGIGDSRSATLGNQIQLFLRDSDGDPLAGFGSKLFSATEFRPQIRFTPTAKGKSRTVAEVVLDENDIAWVTDADPELEHLLVSIPQAKSSLASEGVHLWQLIVGWSDEASEEQTPVSSGSVEWFFKPAAS